MTNIITTEDWEQDEDLHEGRSNIMTSKYGEIEQQVLFDFMYERISQKVGDLT